VATLADALEVPILVEGIENEAAHAAVLAIGCSSGQGWYFGKPMEADQAAQLISRRSIPAAPARNSSRAA
jgi:EAL domain-containing protein (putative c-di-GMP-specific phosphodiesterase class I)